MSAAALPNRKGDYLLAVRADCVPNPGPGGWAVEVSCDGKAAALLKGGDPHTTVMRMELTAALAGVRAVQPGASAVMATRSKYLSEGIGRWTFDGGRIAPRNGGSRSRPASAVRNGDLWIPLLEECARRSIVCTWVARHDESEWFGHAAEAARAGREAAALESRAGGGSPARQAPPADREKSADVLVYTDGSCLTNPGPGGWGSVLVRGAKVERLHGRDENTTNNRMELTAAIESLKSLGKDEYAAVHTDSTYVQQGITRWCRNWIAKGMLDPAGGAGAAGRVKNADLWSELIAVSSGRRIDWNWVRGHAGDEYNEMAHQLAYQAALKGAA